MERRYPSGYDYDVAEQTIRTCIFVAKHLGVKSMKMSLPGGLPTVRSRLQLIKECIARAMDMQTKTGKDGGD